MHHIILMQMHILGCLGANTQTGDRDPSLDGDVAPARRSEVGTQTA